MKKILATILMIGFLLCTIIVCQKGNTSALEPRHVTVEAENGQYRLHVDGEPFIVKGVERMFKIFYCT